MADPRDLIQRLVIYAEASPLEGALTIAAEAFAWLASQPPCQECGAMTPQEAETRCICAGDKDHCHGCDLWPDDDATPVPAARPSDEEIIAFWSEHCAGDGDAGILRLARWGYQPEPTFTPEEIEMIAAPWSYLQPPPRPIPLSERQPGPEDCIDEGWCWFYTPRGDWMKAVLPVSPAYTHWLPHHALPLPEVER